MAHNSETPIRVGLLGAGTVGSQTARLIVEQKDELSARIGRPIELTGVACLDPKETEKFPWIDQSIVTTDTLSVATNSDIVIELIGGTTVARDVVLGALRAGKNVVTANKALMATHGKEVMEAAEAAGKELAFEASVGGGIPIIDPLKHSLIANEITSVMGIVNGTTNYMLTRMAEDDMPYADVLAEAQAKGFAEADPTADVEGLDARRKIVLSADLAFGVNIREEDIPCVGISSITAGDIAKAKDEGLTYKLIARAEKNGRAVAAFVCPTLFPSSAPEAHTDGTGNLVTLFASRFGKQSFSGAGAGGYPTGSNVLRDCLDVADGCRSFYADSFTPCSVNLSGTQCKWLFRCMGEYFTRECSAREAFDAYESYRKDDPHALLARYAAEEE